MLENLINLVKEQAGDAIVNNPAIPNENNEAAIQSAGESIAGGLQNIISSGGLKDVLKMFGGQGSDVSSSPVTQQISGNVIQDLMSKFNLDQGSASNIASSLVPNVLSNLVDKTNNPSDSSFDIQGIFNSLSGGKTGGMDIQGLLGKVTSGGLDKDGDGDTDLQDVMSMFGGGGKGKGIMDTVKGLFGS
jgi:uncharacterized protein YidB (DUF937 family)